MSHLEVDVGKCIGCRTCEIACSYHHKRVFNPKIASLEIRAAEEWPKKSIALYENFPSQEMGRHLPCDDCQGEPIALCAKYCPVGAIQRLNRGVHSHE
jgi:carbon-monoxide dehydrogenase iron sulfur subunit